MTQNALSWLVILATLASTSAASQREVTRHPVVPAPDADGDYRWRWTDSAGAEREWVLVPENKIAPMFRVAMSRSGDGSYLYGYSLRNAKSAAQGIHRCYIEIVMPTQVRATPDDWVVAEPQTFAPRVGWALDVGGGGERRGVAPGSEAAGFQLSSALIPGVTTFKCNSDSDPTPWPDDLPRAILKQLEQLPPTLDVRGQTIGPVLASPDGSFETLVPRVIRNYRQALRSSQLTDRIALVQELDSLANARGDTAQAILKRIIGRLSYRGPDPWSRQLAQALTLCLQDLFTLAARQP